MNVIAGVVLTLLLAFPCAAAAQEPGAKYACTILRRPSPNLISPDIYGLAAPSSAAAMEWKVPLIRWGGNTAERYNWKLGNAWSTGKDWFFENVAIEPNAWQGFLERGERSGARVFFNLPMIGFAAKDTTSHSFSVRKYGQQQKHDPYRPDAGNGVRPDGSPIRGNDRSDSAIVADPEFIAEWVQAMKQRFPRLFSERRIVFALGNEPMLWHLTHRDVRPEPVSYDEYLRLFVRLAKAVKAAAPEAELAGPELWGWPAYFHSALDLERKSGDDRRRHGGEDFLPWFLRQMRAVEKESGVRLLDYVTVHFYPQADNVFSDAVDPTAARLRFETVRSLWDQTYHDPSWIGAKVGLIPRLKRWVADAYPGTRIGLTEYNWGGEKDISGGLALADILGLFGREGLDMASYWSTPPNGSFAAAAYALYRNPDGAGGAFGNEGMEVRWDGGVPEHLSIYAAVDQVARVVSVVAVNGSGKERALLLSFRGVEVGEGRAFVMDRREPRVAATGSASPLRPLIVGPQSAVHCRFSLK